MWEKETLFDIKKNWKYLFFEENADEEKMFWERSWKIFVKSSKNENFTCFVQCCDLTIS